MNSDLQELRAYVDTVTGGASWRAIATAIRIEPSTITRQFSRGRVPASTIVGIARAYHGDLLDGLVAGDVITAEEAEQVSRRGGLRDASDLQLAEELLRRARLAAGEPAVVGRLVPVPLDEPADAAGRSAGGSDVAGEFEDDAAALSDVPVTPEAESQSEEP